jgi:AAHS family 4-hydroxybenzoate transporter-like MFS transporter
MFFFGYVTTSIIAYWLPTILSHRAASPFMILVTFGALNVGGVLGTLALGFIASRAHSRHLLSIAWAAAGVCGLGAAVAGLGTDSIAVLAIGGSTIGAAAQALSVALANAMHREWGLEATSVGFMSGAGRIGQMCALSVSGTVIAFGGRETLLLGMAGVCACIAALLSLLPARPSPTKPAERPAF